MKVVTANFITCAVKDCKSFPLHFRDAKLELQELDFQAEFIQNIIPRLDWDKLQITANELGFSNISNTKPNDDALNNEQILRDLHKLLLEIHVMEGKLLCGGCGHEYMIKEGIANFLLPSHLV